MIKVGGALLQLQQLGYVHNNLQPKNIVMDFEGKELALINFSEARQLTDQTKSQSYSSKLYSLPYSSYRFGDSYNDAYMLGALYFVAFMRVTELIKIKDKHQLQEEAQIYLKRKDSSKSMRAIIRRTVLMKGDEDRIMTEQLMDMMIKFLSE